MINLQQKNNNAASVNVEFRENISADQLSKITGVDNVQQLSAARFQLTGAQPEAIRKQLLQLSIENNWNIVSLQNESNSLEDVFRGLTGN